MLTCRRREAAERNENELEIYEEIRFERAKPELCVVVPQDSFLAAGLDTGV